MSFSAAALSAAEGAEEEDGFGVFDDDAEVFAADVGVEDDDPVDVRFASVLRYTSNICVRVAGLTDS